MVSIIIPSFNKGRFVEATVRSALDQGPGVEVVVVDDASTDGSIALLRSLRAEHPSMRLIELDRNRGGSYCRNRGLHESTGEFIIFLDADDLLMPGSAERRMRVAADIPEHDLWVFPMLVFRGSPRDVVDRWVPRPGPHLRHFLSHRMDWQTMQPLWRRQFLVELGGFDESFVRLQDPELHVRALQAGARVWCATNEPADCLYRVALDRHDGEALPIPTRHVAGALHFYRVFFDRVSGSDRRALTGTLLECLAAVQHWRRIGHLASTEARQLERRIVDECRLPAHRALLASYGAISRSLPRRVPGITALFRSLVLR
jgi:glycosyltransferase involved in cell wall biosynthesis